MTKTVEYSVVGDLLMGCTACEQRISRALQRLPGIDTVRASSKDQRIVVTIHPKQVSLDQVQARLEQMGYQVIIQGGDK